VTLLVAGENCRPVAEQAARIAGVAKVLLADDSAFKHQLAENVAALMLCSAGLQPSARRRQRKREKHPAARGGPRRRRANLRRDCSGRPVVFKRPIYAGSAIATVESLDPQVVMTLRASSFPAAQESESARRLSRSPASIASRYPALFTKSWRNPIVRSLLPPAWWFPAAVRWAAAKTLP
jgi:electron transfer flavoprotein alpha subunit